MEYFQELSPRDRLFRLVDDGEFDAAIALVDSGEGGLKRSDILDLNYPSDVRKMTDLVQLTVDDYVDKFQSLRETDDVDQSAQQRLIGLCAFCTTSFIEVIDKLDLSPVVVSRAIENFIKNLDVDTPADLTLFKRNISELIDWEDGQAIDGSLSWLLTKKFKFEFVPSLYDSGYYTAYDVLVDFLKGSSVSHVATFLKLIEERPDHLHPIVVSLVEWPKTLFLIDQERPLGKALYHEEVLDLVDFFEMKCPSEYYRKVWTRILQGDTDDESEAYDFVDVSDPDDDEGRESIWCDGIERNELTF